MKRTEPQSIGDVLRQTLAQEGLESRLLETRAAAMWSSVVGPEIASRTSRPAVNKGMMTVWVRNASLRHELNMSRNTLARLINDSLGKTVITDIRFK